MSGEWLAGGTSSLSSLPPLPDKVVQPVCEAGHTSQLLNEILVQIGLIKVREGGSKGGREGGRE